MDRLLRNRLDVRLGALMRTPIRQRDDETEIRVAPGDVPQVLTILHDSIDLRFEVLADLAGVDTGTEMQVVYHLWSPTFNDWLRIVAEGISREDPRAPSATFLWSGAEWLEREAYDMFGIVFEGNRDLRRILMPADYKSFPLRKDFLLGDDASRTPGAGVRHSERAPRPATLPIDEVTHRDPAIRRAPGS